MQTQERHKNLICVICVMLFWGSNSTAVSFGIAYVCDMMYKGKFVN